MHPQTTMPVTTTTIPVSPDTTTLINILTVEPEQQSALLALLQENTDTVISGLDGWISTSLIAAKDGRRVVIYSQWRDVAAVEAMRANPDMRRYFPRITALATFDSFAGEVGYARHA
jgi:quinol monooxygenase YgiN